MIQNAFYILAAIVLITVLLILGSAAGSRWCRSVFTAWDFLGAAIFGGDGEHSISAYCGRAVVIGRPRVLVCLYRLIDAIFGDEHCLKAYRKEF